MERDREALWNSNLAKRDTKCTISEETSIMNSAQTDNSMHDVPIQHHWCVPRYYETFKFDSCRPFCNPNQDCENMDIPTRISDSV